MGELIPIEEAATRTGLSLSTLRRRVRDGALPGYKLCGIGKTLIPVAELEKQLQAVGAGPGGGK
jgi:excisionase family DNA binding protein